MRFRLKQTTHNSIYLFDSISGSTVGKLNGNVVSFNHNYNSTLKELLITDILPSALNMSTNEITICDVNQPNSGTAEEFIVTLETAEGYEMDQITYTSNN